jgi:hypothetical protein
MLVLLGPHLGRVDYSYECESKPFPKGFVIAK